MHNKHTHVWLDGYNNVKLYILILLESVDHLPLNFSMATDIWSFVFSLFGLA